MIHSLHFLGPLIIGPTVVAFTTSSLILSFPAANKFSALTLFATMSPNSSSESEKMTMEVRPPLKQGSGLYPLTSRVISRALSNSTGFSEVNVPGVGLAGSIGYHKGEDSVAVLGSIIMTRFGGV